MREPRRVRLPQVWTYGLSAGVAVFLVWVLVRSLLAEAPATIAVFRSAALPTSVVRVAEETARRHGPADLRIHSFTYPASRADIVSLVRRVVEELRPAAVIDLGSSNEGLVASTVLDQEGVPHVLPVATSKALQRATARTFPLLPTDSTQGVALARHAAEERRLKRVALFYLDSEHGIGIREGFVPEAARLGLDLLTSVAFTYVEDPQTVVDAALLRGTPDGVVVAGYSGTGGPLIRALRRRLLHLPILGSDGLASNPLLLVRGSGPDREPLYLAWFWRLETSGVCSEGFPEWLPLDSAAPVTGVEGLIHDAVAPVAEALRGGWTEREEVARYLGSLGRSDRSFEGVTGGVVFGGGRPGIQVRISRMGGSLPPIPEERE